MANLANLVTRLGKLEKELAEFGNRAAKETATAIISDLATNTPVDVGQHVSSWEVGIDGPADGSRSPYAPGAGGSTADANAAAVIAAGKAVIARKSPGQTIYISNSAPAIGKLNDGSSDKAPAGFVERATLVGRLAAKRVRFR